MRISRTALLVATTALTLGLTACDAGGTEPAATSASGTTALATESDSPTSELATTEAPEPSTSTALPGAPAGGERRTEPKNLDAATQGLVANPAGPTSNTMGIYMDPQCPACRQGEQVTGPAVDKAVAAKTARIVFHPMTFLDDMLKNSSSKTMANAVTCASDADGKLLPFVKEMYAMQPAKEGDGYPADAPATIAGKIGLTGADRATFDTCVQDNWYGDWIKQAQSQYEKDGVTGTPTYKHNGQKIDLKGFSLDDFGKKLAG